MSARQGEHPPTGVLLVAQHKIFDWLFYELAGFLVLEIAQMQDLYVNQITRPALKLRQRMCAGEQDLESCSMLDQMTQHAKHGRFVKAFLGKCIVEFLELVKGEEDKIG